MKTSHKGVVFLAKEEAIVLAAYQDGEHMSIGAGHNDPALKPGDTISLEKAIALLASDLESRDAAITRMLKVPVEQHEFDPLVSAYYNAGSKVRLVVDLINHGERDEAMATMLTYNRTKEGKFKPGLAHRRIREMDVFLFGNYGDLSTVKIWRGDPNKTRPEEMAFPA